MPEEDEIGTSERKNSRTQASQLMSVVEIEQPEETRLVLGPELAGTLMTPDEFHDADEVDEDFRYELIHGVLVVTPPPLEEERGPNEELGVLLHLYRMQHPQGSALDDTLSEQHVSTATAAAGPIESSGPGWDVLRTRARIFQRSSSSLSPKAKATACTITTRNVPSTLRQAFANTGSSTASPEP